MDNAMRARQLVGELFQDLDRFSFDEYRDLDDGGESMARLIAFCTQAATAESGEWTQTGENCYRLVRRDAPAIEFTSDREKAIASEGLALIGLEHPVIRSWIDRWAMLPAENRGLCAQHPSAPLGVYSCREAAAKP